MYEATFRIEGDGAYAAATAGTDAAVELWCNDHCDLLYVTEDATDGILAHVRERVGVQDLLRRPDELVIVTGECLQRREGDLIESYLARHDCLLLPPLRYAGGAKSCRVLALDPANLTACYRDLIDDGFSVSVERKREIETVTHDAPLLTLDGVLPDLSARQRETFGVAYDRGYYEIPREVTTAEIADAVGVERRTAEEHLRRAENKLVAALIEYVRA
ncbi:transcriptional regulator [Halobacteriales archaeon QS_7_68_65]|jgi:predicted DNA binding protein|nr:MAG: transcriptional regulator [Halobacteriales archaeon QS_7_68_65]